MNAPHPDVALAPTLAEIGLAALAPSGDAAAAAPADGGEARWLQSLAGRLALNTPSDLAAALAAWRAAPPAADQRLAALAATLGLSLTEVLAVALVCAAETQGMAARALAWLQAPVAGARPSAGLVAQIAVRLQCAASEAAALAALAAGAARQSGMLRLDDEHHVLPEAPLGAPQPIVLALLGLHGTGLPPRAPWPGVRFGLEGAPVLAEGIRDEARRHAEVLARGGAAALVVRSGHPREAQAAAAEVAAQMRAHVVFVDGEVPVGLGPWLWLMAALPVFKLDLAPGERRRIEPVAGWRGPLLATAGLEGSVECLGETAPSWRVPIPPASQRMALWQAALGGPGAGALSDAADAASTTLARELGQQHRHAAARIAELGRAARYEAQLEAAATAAPTARVPERLHVQRAARRGAPLDLGALAEALPDEIADAALVLAPALRAELEALAARCLARDTLAEGLGPSAQARFRPGVRALFVGPSGTGKSLAVGWLATRLGLPLVRVDLASVTSKYIGETEKNLAQLFARAEHAEVVLMFDEADALFGKRTDVKDSNDRFANAQTNYLLGRIESFEGIAILTSNSRARFDAAFTRRLDAIVEFPAPGPQERRELWLAHLGAGHGLSAVEINRLAADCELAGGHVRNAVLSAAQRARSRGARAPSLDDVRAALVAEYRKLGQQLPQTLVARIPEARS